MTHFDPTSVHDASPSLDRRTLLLTATAGLTASALTLGVLHPSASLAAVASVPDPEAFLATGLAAGIPGIALMIDRDGELLYSGAAGFARIEEQTPVAVTDRFRIYSITKMFTATVVLQLVDEGIVTLDDTVSQWLDQPEVARIPNVDRVTIRQLLHHTSGIYDFADDDDSPFWDDAFLGETADWSKVWTLPELLAYADGDNHAPYFAPGEGNHYSNTNYLLVGMIIEQATGSDFGEQLDSRIFKPLGLDDTSLATGGTIPDGVVDGYQVLDGELVNVTEINLSWVWAAGGLVSTTADLLRFSRALAAGDLLESASQDEMFTLAPLATSSSDGGIFRFDSPMGVVVAMDGESAGFNANLMWLPENDITVVSLTNRAPDDGASEAVRDAAFAWALSQ